PSPPQTHPLPLHDALPISAVLRPDRTDEVVAALTAILRAVERDVAPPLDALSSVANDLSARGGSVATRMINVHVERIAEVLTSRSEEHTSELQSRENLVCR